MSEPIYCGYAGCYCLLPAQIEGACEDCELKKEFHTKLKLSDVCPNGFGECLNKNCISCSRFIYAIHIKD